MMEAKNFYQRRAYETATCFLIKPNGELRPCVNRLAARAAQYEFGGQIITRKQAVARKLI